MRLEIDDDEVFRRYLLDALSEEERIRLEERYFTDTAAFDQFLAVKDELIDAYSRGELTGERRARFEKHFLSTRPRRQSVNESKELIDFSTRLANAGTAAVEPKRPALWGSRLETRLRARQPILQFALAVLLLAIGVGGVWLWIKMAERQTKEQASVSPSTFPETITEKGTEPPVRNVETPRTTPEPPPARDSAPKKQPDVRPTPAPHVASITLTPILTRDVGEANTLILRPNTGTARLRLGFKNGRYRSYSALVKTIDGTVVWNSPTIRARTPTAGQNVVIDIPAEVFTRKDYTITLNGLTSQGETKEINEYFLTIRKSATR